MSAPRYRVEIIDPLTKIHRLFREYDTGKRACCAAAMLLRNKHCAVVRYSGERRNPKPPRAA